ncbi:AimR family lysis-lysogeny pheromone receptor [Peribacillus simplex]|uniref:AimR family lysis-lysogeny pheromone receptor n=1 Tax=Peribacillus simplex TaxID=1478 RepID=UPI00366FADCB
MEQTLTKSNIQKLEYFDNYKMKQEKRLLIDQMLLSEDQNEVEWATLYDIDDHYTAKRISDVQARKAYNDFKPFNRDVETGIKIFKCYMYAEEQNFGFLDDYTMGLENEIDVISNDYIRGMYKVRFSIITLTSLVAKDYIKEARQICEKLMNENLDNYYSSLVSLQYGNTFMLDNPAKAIEIYEKGLILTNSEERCEVIKSNLENSLDFANILIGNYPKYLKFESKNPSDVHNLSFWYLKKGNKVIGESLLNTVDYDSLTDVQKAFHHYYRGFVSEPMKHFAKALTYFKLDREFYFRKLALYELEKLGVDINLIEALSV